MEGVIVRLTYTAHGNYVRTGRRKEKEKIPCKENHTFHNMEGRKGSPTMGSLSTWDLRTEQTITLVALLLSLISSIKLKVKVGRTEKEHMHFEVNWCDLEGIKEVGIIP